MIPDSGAVRPSTHLTAARCARVAGSPPSPAPHPQRRRRGCSEVSVLGGCRGRAPVLGRPGSAAPAATPPSDLALGDHRREGRRFLYCVRLRQRSPAECYAASVDTRGIDFGVLPVLCCGLRAAESSRAKQSSCTHSAAAAWVWRWGSTELRVPGVLGLCVR